MLAVATPPAPKGPKALSLRELSEEAQALDDLTAMDDGEWTEEAAALHAELMAKLLNKTDAFAGYLRELELREANHAAEIERLTQRRKTLVARIAWMKQYAVDAMGAMQAPKLEGELFTLARQKNSTPALLCTLLPESAPPQFVTIIPATKELNKPAIVAALKGGATIEGCELAYGYHLRVR